MSKNKLLFILEQSSVDFCPGRNIKVTLKKSMSIPNNIVVDDDNITKEKEKEKEIEKEEEDHSECGPSEPRVHEFVLPIIGSSLTFLIAFALRDAISASFELLPIKTPRVWTMWILVMLKLMLVVAIFISLNYVGFNNVFPRNK
jgi:hypothetical protein